MNRHVRIINSLAVIAISIVLTACSSGGNSELDQQLNSSSIKTNQTNSFDLFHPIRVSISDASQSFCNAKAQSALGYSAACTIGGACDGVAPSEWGTCKLAPIAFTERSNASVVTAKYQASDALFPKAKAAASMLKHFYVTVYHREPDEAGFYFWLNEHFNNNASLPAQPARHLGDAIIRATECAEFMNAQSNISVTAEPFLFMVYRSILGREPDTAGLNYWKNAMINQSNSPDVVLDSFYLSTDFTAYAQSYGL